MNDHMSRPTDTMTPAVPLAPTPRPTYDGPAHIPASAAAQHLWGDQESGHVADWVYASTSKIHHLVFGLAPGRSFRHSPDFRTVFAADELLYVLSGTMVIVNPQLGEVNRIETGATVFFRRDTWHHAFAFGPEPLRVLEFFAPPPAAGTSSSYARAQPYLDESSYRDDRWLGRWPAARAERDAKATIVPIAPGDVLWMMDGHDTLVGIHASTEHLTAGVIEQRPGANAPRSHGGDASFHVVRGTQYMLITAIDGEPTVGKRWYELQPGDGFYVPEGTTYELHNVGAETTELVFAVAPSYDPR